MCFDVPTLLEDNLKEILAPMPGAAAPAPFQREQYTKLTERVLPELQKDVGRAGAICKTLMDVATPGQYEAVCQTHPDIFHEERCRLGRVIQQAFETHLETAPWALFYMVFGFRQLVVLSVRRRTKPEPNAQAPSAFVYCMQ
jgi:hypothetical protein